MRWEDIGRSRNIEDRRGGGGRVGRGMAGLPMSAGGIIVLLVLSLVFRTNLFSMVGMVPGATPSTTSTSSSIDDPQEEAEVRFLSFVLDDIQETWTTIFADGGLQYQDARLVLYRQLDQSACGMAQAAMGPFYCPADQRVYLDLSFFDELSRRLGAPGDFAEAYVVAHEMGHHVQNLLGLSSQVSQAQRANPGNANELSVALELQADCFAGVWGASAAARGLLEQGDLEEGLTAAAAVGDDRLQRETTGRVTPDTFTHGTSAQRMQWFRTGFDSGSASACETFQGN